MAEAPVTPKQNNVNFNVNVRKISNGYIVSGLRDKDGNAIEAHQATKAKAVEAITASLDETLANLK